MEFDSFVLAASTADLDDEPAARGTADAVEFRMDLAGDPLDALAAYDGDLPVIATNRAAWEGGEASPDGRLGALTAAVDHDAVAAIDVELATLRGYAPGATDASVEDTSTEGVSVDDLVARTRERGVTVIASVHDFETTPAPAALDGLLRAAAGAGDVGKLAVTAESAGDALNLLAATHRATTRGDSVATMAMGGAGAHTRAVAPAYGSRIGYAPVRPEAATAPGQYDLDTLRDLVDRLTGES